MSARIRKMTSKANHLFSHNSNYTFRELMESYRFWKGWLKRNNKQTNSKNGSN